ncbi:ABC transporter permease [Leptolyngbya sp. GB1-A1]|uniref:ABC transporter permease n=1 Tax=Leptolyngbya sp. GB1-A1 TaxID=2933908 RepID=UPI0032974A43
MGQQSPLQKSGVGTLVILIGILGWQYFVPGVAVAASSAFSSVINGLLISALRSSTPLLFVLLGEMLTQRTGIINLGVEGQMLVGAFAGFAATVTFHNSWLGFLVGGLVGLLLSTVHAWICLGCRGNQIASGIGIWILGSGISAFYGRNFVGQTIAQGFSSINLLWLTEIPILGAAIAEITPMISLAIVLPFVVGVWLYGTRTGLTWRAVGESTAIARAMGICPELVQLQGILVGGFLSGLGGAVLSVDYTFTWAEGMTVGRGLVAVGLVIVARWNPYWAMPVALLFGGSEALYLRLQAVGVPVSSYLLATLPYIVSLGVLMIHYRKTNQSGGMPDGLRSIFSSTY